MKVSQQAHVVLSLGQRELQIPPWKEIRCAFRGLNCCGAELQVGEVSTVALAGCCDGYGAAAESEDGKGRGDSAGGLIGVGGTAEESLCDAVFYWG